MGDFENKKTTIEQDYYSRYIASYCKIFCQEVLGYEIFGEGFEDWLRSHDMNEEEVRRISIMANCGKYELEQDLREKRYFKKDRN